MTLKRGLKPFRVALGLVAVGLAAAAASNAQAQKLVPGLWENSVTLKSGDGRMEAAMAQMQERLASMPPEKRKQMEAMMANQGVGLGGGGGAATTIRVCISKEQAERQEMPAATEGRCQRETLERSGSTLKFKFTCSDPASTGEGSYTFSSDKAYSGNLVVNANRNGRDMRMDMQQQGKWLGADCGALKPRP